MLKMVIPLALLASNGSASSENCGTSLPFAIAALATDWASLPPPPSVVVLRWSRTTALLLSLLPHAAQTEGHRTSDAERRKGVPHPDVPSHFALLLGPGNPPGPP